MRTIAYYVWRVEMAIRNLLNIFFILKHLNVKIAKGGGGA